MPLGIANGLGLGLTGGGGLYAAYDLAFNASSLSRTGNASLVTSADTIQTTSGPRIGHYVWDGWKMSNAGLLFEQSGATNLIAQSDDLSVSPWSLTFCTFNAGTQTLTSTGGGFARYSTSGLTTSTTYTASYEVAPGSLSWALAFIRNKASSDSSAYINLATGAVGTTSGTATWATKLVNGYVHIEGTFDSGSGATTPFIQLNFATANGSTGASAGNTIKVRRIQLEQGSRGSSLVPTTGSTASRSAESISVQPAHSASGVWGYLKGSEIYIDAGTADQVLLFDWRADSNNRITVSLDTDGTKTGDITLKVVNGGVSQTVSASVLSPGRYQPFEIAWRVSATDINLAIAGHAQTAASISGIPNLAGVSATLGGNGTRLKFRTGTGAITDAQLETYGGKPTETHVVLLAGQSNMSGRATYDSLGGHPDFVEQWNQSGALVAATVPLDHPSQPAGTMGPDITFATRYRLLHPEANLVFVPCAVGSTGFTDNNWNSGNTQYNNAVSRTLAAISATGGTLKAILWVQGEQDALDSMTQANYAAALDAMIAAMRTAFSAPAVPFIAGQISPSLAGGTFPTATQVNAALADLPNRVIRTAYASSTGLTTLIDGVHYSATNLRTLGSRLFDALRSIGG